jgi:hypothetical protein
VPRILRLKMYKIYGKCKNFLMAVYMIFKYSKRFRFTPSFNYPIVCHNFNAKNATKKAAKYYPIVCHYFKAKNATKKAAKYYPIVCHNFKAKNANKKSCKILPYNMP